MVTIFREGLSEEVIDLKGEQELGRRKSERESILGKGVGSANSFQWE